MNIQIGTPIDEDLQPLKLQHTETNTSSILARQLASHFERVPLHRSIVFVCIGTDRSTGDSLGPLVGSRLRKISFADVQLFGTLDEPVHAMNLLDTLQTIDREYHSPYIVGIDACLGQLSSVGCIQLGVGPLKPGAGVNKQLPPVGDIHLTGIVNVGGFMEYFVLQNTRLSLVMSMADVLAKSIYMALLQSNRMPVLTRAAKRLDR